MAKLSKEQKQALVDQMLAIPAVKSFAELTQFKFSSDGTRQYTQEELIYVSNFVNRLKQNRSIVNDERENIKVAAILADRTQGFNNPASFELKGELTGEIINFLGEAYFDNPSHPEDFARDIDVLLGIGISYKYDVDYSKYQLDVSVVGRGANAGEWAVGLTFRPIPKIVATT